MSDITGSEVNKATEDVYLGCHLSDNLLAKCPVCEQQMYYDDVEDIYFCKTHGGCFQLA
jgi:hypothetical protein